MSARKIDDLSLRQRERLTFVEDLLYWAGRVSSTDVSARFGVSKGQAAQDVASYRAAHPARILYDPAIKAFAAPDNFTPIMTEQDIARFLALVKEADVVPGGIVDFAVLRPPARRVDPEMARSLVQAMMSEAEVLVSYVSMSTGETTRWLTPHALASDGRRYHVRAWDDAKARFGDFVLARIERVLDSRPSTVDVDEDADWFETAPIELVPNPALSEAQCRMVRFDYGIEGDHLTLHVRRAMVLYLNSAMLLHSELSAMPNEHLYRPLVPKDQAAFDALIASMKG